MLHVKDLTFSYSSHQIISNISFTADKGAHISIIGESGCGKSTLLKLLYGILQPTHGNISWGDNPILGPDFKLVPGETFMKYLSQDFDLMPYVSVEENVSQYLSVFYPQELKERTEELLEMIEMTAFAKTKVKLLSGGQQQRVALARVLAQKPEILLLDEPFSHIDNSRKNSLRRNLFNYLKTEQITCIVASHDTHDILSFADEVMVLKEGKILAKEHPETLYMYPKNSYTASLFGDVNLIPISLLKPYATLEKSILVYPSELIISENSGLKVWVKNSYFKGSHYLIEAQLNETAPILFNAPHAYKAEKEVFLNVALETINARIKD